MTASIDSIRVTRRVSGDCIQIKFAVVECCCSSAAATPEVEAEADLVVGLGRGVPRVFALEEEEEEEEEEEPTRHRNSDVVRCSSSNGG
jgi:hypothetical protein